MWTKERMLRLLRTNDLAVERAIVALYDRQTQDEKRDSDTKHHNRMGFRSNHASTCSFLARIILGGWKKPRGRLQLHLFENKLDKARHIVLQYTRQLCEEANARESAKHPSAAEVGTQASPHGTTTMSPGFTVKDERAMQALEAQGDREGTRRDEVAKHDWKTRSEKV